jgi:hypothetical protein
MNIQAAVRNVIGIIIGKYNLRHLTVDVDTLKYKQAVDTDMQRNVHEQFSYVHDRIDRLRNELYASLYRKTTTKKGRRKS